MANFIPFTLLILTLSISSCFQFGTQQIGNATIRNGEGAQVMLKTDSSPSGGVSATLNADSLATQIISSPANGTIKGAQLSFPPGSLAISSTIMISEGTNVANATALAELKLTNAVSASGTSVTVSTSAATDAKQPFQISIPLPVSSPFRLADDWTNLIVIYKVTHVSELKNVVGVVPRSNITVKDGFAEISTLHFGSFQAALTSETVSTGIEVATNTMILTKEESSSLQPISVLNRTPLVLKSNGTVELNGINFRKTMVVALGGVQVRNLNIKSDSSASFIAPDLKVLGLLPLAIEQDGLSLTASIFYAGDKGDFPIITKVESEVCSGEEYYDGNGVLRTGTRTCLSSAPTNTVDLTNLLPANIKTGIVINGVSGTAVLAPANCSVDGETNCVANSGYPAMNLTGAAAKISNGSILGNVTGTAAVRPADCMTPSLTTSCVATTSFPAVDLSYIQANIHNIRLNTTIAGTVGTLNDCVDGGIDCYVVSGFKAANATNLLPGNIRNSIMIAGTTGTFAPNCNVNNQLNCNTVSGFPSVEIATFGPWDLRAGKTIGGIIGNIAFDKGKASVTNAFFDRTGLAGSITGIDIYDTIDDDGLPTDLVPTFTNVAGNIVRDTVSDTTSNGICDTAEDCVYKDSMTGLLWSKVNPSAAGLLTWDNAISNCDALIYGTYSDWRLPTQKELMQAYIDGLYYKNSATELGLSGTTLWSGTTASAVTNNAIVFSLTASAVSSALKTGTYSNLCVR